jgi:hypothetical protein
MDHQKQIRDSLEKHNQLVCPNLYRFSRGPTPSIHFARSAKNAIKTTTIISVQKNTEKESDSAPTTTTSNKYATFISNFGTAAKKKQKNRRKNEHWKKNSAETEFKRFTLKRRTIPILWRTASGARPSKIATQMGILLYRSRNCIKELLLASTMIPCPSPAGNGLTLILEAPTNLQCANISLEISSLLFAQLDNGNKEITREKE